MLCDNDHIVVIGIIANISIPGMPFIQNFIYMYRIRIRILEKIEYLNYANYFGSNSAINLGAI